MKSSSFGLDIGQSMIKAVWLSHEKEGYLLDAVLAIPTPGSGILSESPEDQENLAGTIRKMISDARISARSVNIALSESQVYTKVIQTPILSDKDLSSAIYWEAEQQIPVPLASLTLDYKVLERPNPGDTSKTMKVLLVGASTRLLDKYQRVFSLAGLQIAAIETEVLATIRSLIPDDKYPPSLVVNIGTFSTSLTIVRKNEIVFTYSIPIGGLAMTRAISSKFSLSTAQSEEYKKIYGMSENEFGGKIAQAVEPVLSTMLTEIKKAFAYYRNAYKDDPIMQITIAGGSAKLPGLASFFAQNAGIETVIANPWKMLYEQDVPKEIIDNAPDYAVAAGLAMRNDE